MTATPRTRQPTGRRITPEQPGPRRGVARPRPGNRHVSAATGPTPEQLGTDRVDSTGRRNAAIAGVCDGTGKEADT